MLSKLRHIILFGSILVGFHALSQPYFNKLIDKAYLYNSVLVTDTGFIAVGGGFVNAYRSLIITAFNHEGDSLWSKSAGMPPNASTARKILAADSGFYVSGVIKDTADVTPWDFYLAYFSPQGDSVWLKRYGKAKTMEFLEDAIITANGDVVMVGVNRTESGDRDAWYVVKTDAQGKLIWEKTLDGIENENGCRSIIETPEGDYVLVGEQEVAEKQYDIWVVKLNSDGDRLWDTTYGGEFTDFSPEINLAPDGHLGMAFDYLQSSKSESRAIRYIKMNRFTTEVMTDVAILDFNEGSVLTKPLYDEYGNVIIAGNFVVEFDLIGLVIKFNPATGNIIWSREYTRNSNLQHYIYDIQPASNDGFVFCGSGFPEDHMGGVIQGWITTIDCKGADSLTHYFPNESCEDYTSISESTIAIEDAVNLYPNPTNGSVSLRSSTIMQNVVVYSITGSLVHQQSISASKSAEVKLDKTLPNGIYLVEIKLQNGEKMRKKLSLMR
tara:strand:- start:42020 stop:43507 length:1488 start_codon:yes stop_codon:yes gene_type:complete